MIMAGHKLLPFFEEEIPEPLPESKNWLLDYHRFSRQLAEYLKTHGASKTSCQSAIHCLTELRDYLLENHLPYTAENATVWCGKIEFSYPKSYQATLYRLADLYDYGEIQQINAFPYARHYAKLLHAPWDGLLDNYLGTLVIIEKSKTRVRLHISRFLFWIQGQGIDRPSEISYEILEAYLEQDFHRSAEGKSRYTFVIGNFISFMADRGLCCPVLGWLPYYWMHNRLLRRCDLTKKQLASLNVLRQECPASSLKEIIIAAHAFLNKFKESGYSETACELAVFALHNLLLFLDMSGVGFHRDAIKIWLDHERGIRKGREWLRLQRVLDLFGLYLREGEFKPEVYFCKRPRLYDSIPAWCKVEVDKYLELRRKVGLEQSTINGESACIAQFCIFLGGRGLSSFSAITPDILGDFNTSDEFSALADKNTYSGIIRQFLQHLERQGILPYGRHLALSCASIRHEKVVIVLTEEEKSAIAEKLSKSSSSIELRDKAMMLLGMKMGLRGCDIVTIRLADIDWAGQTLRVFQEKTDHEMLLPMPVNVGNAIYDYIKNGRPNEKTHSEYLFVKTVMPYDGLKSSACLSALKRVLPKRSVPGSGFHVTRKTYATDRLRSGAGKQGIVDLLGHQGTQSLEPYLQMDEEHMRMCPISLSESGLLMKGGYYGTV